ncbi:ankyrin repeat-containing domain protein [Amylocarpus encephaloides]|uniref:Ankyrin repeat-containing domain protein n=1 Tax=Amylocarpus encephaloides TaxID=45428 RepID=A0A9P7YPP5_9HELO|nr:ankyrin repeat-containing domain protein [Amylocarpus encephaloides]
MASKKKNEAVKAPSEEDWDLHKTTLGDLYFGSTLKEMMQQMKRDHQFVASKNQFERKFKEWGFRKNFTKEELKAVLSKKHKRDREDKASQVSMNGMVIPEKRIRKEESRFTISEVQEIDSALNFPLPEGIVVATPPSFPSPSFPSPFFPSPEGIAVATPPSTAMEKIPKNVPTDNLPGFELFDLFSSITESPSLHLAGHEIDLPHPISSWLQDFIPNTLGFEEYPIPHSPHAENIFTSLSSTLFVPIMTNNYIEMFFMPPIWVIDDPSPLFTPIRAISEAVGPFMLERYDGEINLQLEKLLGPSDLDSFIHFLSFSAYLASNGMLYDNKILNWITSQSRNFLRSMISMQSYTIQACLDALVTSACRFGDTASFEMFFEADVNGQLYRGRRESLMADAVSVGSVETVRSLLKEGKCQRPNGNLLRSVSKVEVARLLVDAGADVNADCMGQSDKLSVNHKSKPAYNALIKGRLEVAEYLIASGAIMEPNTLLATKASLLKPAIDAGNLSLVRHVLSLDVEVDKMDHFDIERDRRTEDLRYACFHGYNQIVDAILQTPLGKSILHSSENGWGPLRDAALNGNVEIVKLLIDAGADVNASSQKPMEGREAVEFRWDKDEKTLPSTPLMAAVERGCTEVVKILLYHSVDATAPANSKYGTQVLDVAELLGHHDIVSLLIEERVPRSSTQSLEQKIMELRLAARRNDIQKAQSLTACGLDVCHVLDALDVIWRKTPYYLRSEEPVENTLSVFLGLCSDKVDGRGPMKNYSALEIAVKYGEYDLAKRLILAGANVALSVPIFGSVLQLSIIYSRHWYHKNLIDFAQFLLEHGGKVNSPRTDYCGTAFEEALKLGRIELVKFLAPNSAIFEPLCPDGVDINTPPANNSGRTVLQAAAVGGDLEFIKSLLDNGANINAKPAPNRGITALQGAAIEGNIRIAHLLLEHGADPNAPGAEREGRTALEGAAERGRLDMVQLLMISSAEPSEKAFLFAEREMHFVIADIIRKAIEEKKADE